MDKKKIVLGTVQLGKKYGINNSTGQPSREAALGLLETAYQNGILLYDTADSYGESSSILGEFNRLHPDINILTKGSIENKSLEDAVKHSLQQLGVNHVHAFSLHNPNDLKLLRADEITLLKKRNLISKFGISVYTNQEVLDASKIEGIDIIQLPLNLLDNWNLRMDSILEAKKNGKEIHVRSVFLQGLFFKNLQSLPVRLNPLLESLRLIQNLALRNKITVEALALGYVGSLPYLDKILIGVETTEQLLNNLELLSASLSGEVLGAINNIKILNVELLNPSNWN